MNKTKNNWKHLFVNEDLHTQLKIKAINDKVKLGELVERLLLKALAIEEPSKYFLKKKKI